MMNENASDNLDSISKKNTLVVHNDFKLSRTDQTENLVIAANLSVLMHTEAKKLLTRSYYTEITQQEIIEQINAISRLEGGDNALSFPTLIYSGDDFQFLHGNPYDDIDHIIDPSVEPIVMIDLGAQFNGMCSDVTRTYFFENASEEMKQAYQVVIDAELAVIEAIKPGVRVGDLDDILYAVYNQSGFTMEGAYIYPRWGHGVRTHVHEMPVLGHPAYENYTIMVGEALAIEPSYFNLEDGWSVRVEDTILVTASGNVILSDSLPRQLTEVTILPGIDTSNVKIDLMNYLYHKTASITVSAEEYSEIQTMEFYDGYKWHSMNMINTTSFSTSYYIDKHYSSELLGLVKISLTNSEVRYFSRELHLIPQGKLTSYSTNDITAKSDDYDNTTYGGTYDLTTEEWAPSYKYSWIFSASDVDLIRIHFKNASFNQDDSFLLLDENDNLNKEYFVFHNTTVNQEAFWSPWISGSMVKLSLEPLSRYGFHKFSFTIDQVEIITLEVPSTSESIPSTSSSTMTSSKTNAFDILGGIGICFLSICWRKKR
ncbi:MAG: M24 family metallopeptidase [Candidatus Hodarchaeales archaeon]